MFYGCKFSLTENFEILDFEIITHPQFEEINARESVHAYGSGIDVEDENLGFAVFYSDEYDLKIYHLYLDDKFLNEASISKIEASLELAVRGG
ncbi:TPA: hypothetical protein R8G29_005071 [Citrobacter freundii]|nr:hypothetical protein [Citrobacter freundii]